MSDSNVLLYVRETVGASSLLPVLDYIRRRRRHMAKSDPGLISQGNSLKEQVISFVDGGMLVREGSSYRDRSCNNIYTQPIVSLDQSCKIAIDGQGIPLPEDHYHPAQTQTTDHLCKASGTRR
jgi:hypothetical protein